MKGKTMEDIKVKDLMVPKPMLIEPNATLKGAASIMQKINCDVLPVGTNKNLMGMITDHDIIIRAIAKGKNPNKEVVRNYMTTEIYSCNENDTLKQAANTMKRNRTNKLIVRNGSGDVIGVLSLNALLREKANAEEIADVVTHALNKKRAA